MEVKNGSLELFQVTELRRVQFLGIRGDHHWNGTQGNRPGKKRGASSGNSDMMIDRD